MDEEYIVLSSNEYTPAYLQERGISYEVEVRGERRGWC
jgi:hypothetical protein